MKAFPIIINNKQVISTDVYEFIKHGKSQNAIEYLVNETNCTEEEAIEVVNELKDLVQSNIKTTIEKHKQPIHESTTKIIDCTKNNAFADSNIPKCPKCGSNQITTGQRGFSIWTGFLGSNKTVNRCAKCGYSWSPR